MPEHILVAVAWPYANGPRHIGHVAGFGVPSDIFARFQRPEFQARLRWRKNTLAVWDNRATIHYALNDYGDQHRLLHRVTFGEEQAF